HAIGLRDAARHQVVDENAEVCLVAPWAPAGLAAREQRRVDPGEQPLRRGLFVPRCADEGELKPWRGKPTLELAAPSLDGANVDLRNLRGRVVIVNFWATWCEPCREEMPSLERLRDKLAGKPFAILAVNYGESREKVAKFLEREMV